MVDRYSSLIGSQQIEEEIPRSTKTENFKNYNRELIQRTNAHATKVR